MLNISSWKDARLDKAPLVHPINPAVISPWVIVRFMNAGKVWVSVGNKSSSIFSEYTDQTNTAVITSFQYGFSTTGANGADGLKVEILAEQGGEFDYFIKEVFPKTDADVDDRLNFGMEFQFGWTYSQCYLSESVIGLEKSRPITKSEPRYTVPRSVTVQLEDGKMKYTIEGPSPLLTLVQNKGSRMVYGVQSQGTGLCDISLKTAISRMFADMGIIALYLTRRENPGICEMTKARLMGIDPCSGEPMVFSEHKTPMGKGETKNQIGPRYVTEDELSLFKAPFQQSLGGVQEWKFDDGSKLGCGHPQSLISQGQDPIDVAMRNLSEKRTEAGNGFIVGSDNRLFQQPIIIFWESPLPGCQGDSTNPLYLGTYIVGGGKYSPVISFRPNIKFNTAHTFEGGNSSGMSAENIPLDHPCSVVGEGQRSHLPISDQALTINNKDAGKKVAEAHQANARSQLSGFQAITAELTVQGEPRAYDPMWLCGHRIVLIVCNPYYIKHYDDGCGNWLVNPSRVANELLTNENWFIYGVDHQIKDGQFTTTYKIMLYTPSVTLDKSAPFGGKDYLHAITSMPSGN